jgi:hypothetical protein
MTTILKLLGVLLILAGLRSLVGADGPAFVMFCALGSALLIDHKSGGAARSLRRALLLVAFVLAFARLVGII